MSSGSQSLLTSSWNSLTLSGRPLFDKNMIYSLSAIFCGLRTTKVAKARCAVLIETVQPTGRNPLRECTQIGATASMIYGDKVYVCGLDTAETISIEPTIIVHCRIACCKSFKESLSKLALFSAQNLSASQKMSTSSTLHPCCLCSSIHCWCIPIAT